MADLEFCFDAPGFRNLGTVSSASESCLGRGLMISPLESMLITRRSESVLAPVLIFSMKLNDNQTQTKTIVTLTSD